MLTRKTIGTLTIAAIAAGLAAGALLGRHLPTPSKRVSHAAWKEVFKTPKELIGASDAIVLAEVVGIHQGRVAYSENGQDSLPFQLVDLAVSSGIKGVNSGERLMVERAGGIDLDGTPVRIDIDGGDFQLGEQVLLFLKRQDQGPYYYQINDQARYAVIGGRLQGVRFNDVLVGSLEGLSVADAEARIGRLAIDGR